MRSVYEVAKDIAELAPNGGATWQNVGMRQVPVRLLTELREAVEREQRVKTYWVARNEGGCGPQSVAVYAGAWKFDG